MKIQIDEKAFTFVTISHLRSFYRDSMSYYTQIRRTIMTDSCQKWQLTFHQRGTHRIPKSPNDRDIHTTQTKSSTSRKVKIIYTSQLFRSDQNFGKMAHVFTFQIPRNISRTVSTPSFPVCAISRSLAATNLRSFLMRRTASWQVTPGARRYTVRHRILSNRLGQWGLWNSKLGWII